MLAKIPTVTADGVEFINNGQAVVADGTFEAGAVTVRDTDSNANPEPSDK